MAKITLTLRASLSTRTDDETPSVREFESSATIDENTLGNLARAWRDLLLDMSTQVSNALVEVAKKLPKQPAPPGEGGAGIA